MASILPHNGGWRAFVAKNNIRRTKIFASKAEASAWAAGLELEIERGAANQERKAGSHALHEAFDRFYRDECPKRPGGEWERRRINKFKKDFKDRPLASVSAEDISEWRDLRLKVTRKVHGEVRPIRPASVRRDMTLLKTIFDVAVRDWGWIKINPVAEVRRPPHSKDRDRIISSEEEEGMLDAMHYREGEVPILLCQNVAIAFLIALETGMREAEICRAEVDGRVAYLSETKNGDSRAVPLSTRAVKLFGLLQPITPRQIDTSFRKARKKAGLEGFTFHDSRATACTRLARKVDVLTLAKIIGHRDINSLMIYYRESADSIADRLG